MTDVKTKKNYLNDVMSLKYSKESDLILKKGALAALTEEYDLGHIDLQGYEVKKRLLEEQIKDLSRNCR